ncbi:hypothetical protein llap_19024 [Limosa lapponica baueri]|uniref:Uncharacterized protein n=1 Tax=Limosa lapponica baueri TaxID=1758121 RepID=A0A2I0TA83_LIMLA|nr:hypothetical protein llap_19024 [Limosa lapponica baueri]
MTDLLHCKTTHRSLLHPKKFILLPTQEVDAEAAELTRADLQHSGSGFPATLRQAASYSFCRYRYQPIDNSSTTRRRYPGATETVSPGSLQEYYKRIF